MGSQDTGQNQAGEQPTFVDWLVGADFGRFSVRTAPLLYPQGKKRRVLFTYCATGGPTFRRNNLKWIAQIVARRTVK